MPLFLLLNHFYLASVRNFMKKRRCHCSHSKDSRAKFHALLKVFPYVPPPPSNEDWNFCYEKLNQVTRSFAVVIQELPEELKEPICIFYLVLRGLDTVEDDTEYLKDNPKEKDELLRTFHERIEDSNFHLDNCGSSLKACPHYEELMMKFHHVCRAYVTLDEKYKVVIKDVTKRMGEGMADTINMKGVASIEEFDEYCHYVAGLVGIGLTDMFIAYGEKAELLNKEGQSGTGKDAERKSLSNLMGLFLQKTNIIRDLAEDIDENRAFWPSEVFQRFGIEKVEELKDAKNIKAAVHTLNALVTNALSQAVDSLEYMTKIKDPKIFSFCAIPQVMAIATLNEIYNNRDVMKKNVKIRKGLTCRILLHSKDINAVKSMFCYFAKEIERKIPCNDPSAEETRKICKEIRVKCEDKVESEGFGVFKTTAVMSIIGGLVYYTVSNRSWLASNLSSLGLKQTPATQ